jgi:quinolinate synthase
MAAAAIHLQAYASLNDEDCEQRIIRAKLTLADRVGIPGRQARASENKSLQFMSPMLCMSSTIFGIGPQHLARVLEKLVEGDVVHRISVPTGVANHAPVALHRMLSV